MIAQDLGVELRRSTGTDTERFNPVRRNKALAESFNFISNGMR
jgi:hypothetical protein